ncbi:hypothetical protein CFO_g4710 [Ceratocystis platani]|uniref:Uncharacterized protein n=1 Tax=Ceratocystis fimbriata f. sp. platani TaxID=88771 RepID=A0A0F8BKS2_CERFI|nr:hypothetical protein CFO_g4710 [Ceratocystis platani]
MPRTMSDESSQGSPDTRTAILGQLSEMSGRQATTQMGSSLTRDERVKAVQDIIDILDTHQVMDECACDMLVDVFGDWMVDDWRDLGGKYSQLRSNLIRHDVYVPHHRITGSMMNSIEVASRPVDEWTDEMMKQYANAPMVYTGSSALQERLTKERVLQDLWSPKQGNVTKGTQDVREEYRQGSATMADKVGAELGIFAAQVSPVVDQHVAHAFIHDLVSVQDVDDVLYRLDTLIPPVKAVNDTSGPEGLVLTMLVFGAYPRPTSVSAPSPSMTRRARAIKMAMAELERFKSTRQVTEALTAKNGPDPETPAISTQVLTWRENAGNGVPGWCALFMVDNGNGMTTTMARSSVKLYNLDVEVETAPQLPRRGRGRGRGKSKNRGRGRGK